MLHFRSRWWLSGRITSVIQEAGIIDRFATLLDWSSLDAADLGNLVVMREQSFLAVDWGTTNRRVFRMNASGSVEQTYRDDHGVLAVRPGGFAAEAEAIRKRMGNLPMLCAGAVGSNLGWEMVPYVPCPADIADLVTATYWIEHGRTAIVPGVAWRDESRSDTMRGEEVQFLGAVLSGMAPAEAFMCQPGTHCKWAFIEGGRITRFTTAMTGEMFSLLKKHSLIGVQMDGIVSPDSEFLRGVEDARDCMLLTRLFGVRADFVTGTRKAGGEASYVSGLLIGSDVRAQFRDNKVGNVHILADPQLGGLYRAAIEAVGGNAILLNSHDAFVAGILEIWRALP